MLSIFPSYSFYNFYNDTVKNSLNFPLIDRKVRYFVRSVDFFTAYYRQLFMLVLHTCNTIPRAPQEWGVREG